MKEKSKNLFGNLVFDGILTILLGVAMIIWPGEALKWVFIVAGIAVGVFGLVKTIIFFADKKHEHTAPELVASICEILLGIALAVFSWFFVTVFHYFIAIVLAFSAVVLLVNAIMLRDDGGIMMILSIVFAVVSAALSVLLFVRPMWVAEIEVRLGGIALIIEGLAMIIFFHKLKKAKGAAKVVVVEETETKDDSEQ